MVLLSMTFPLGLSTGRAISVPVRVGPGGARESLGTPRDRRNGARRRGPGCPRTRCQQVGTLPTYRHRHRLACEDETAGRLGVVPPHAADGLRGHPGLVHVGGTEAMSTKCDMPTFGQLPISRQAQGASADRSAAWAEPNSLSPAHRLPMESATEAVRRRPHGASSISVLLSTSVHPRRDSQCQWRTALSGTLLSGRTNTRMALNVP